MLTCIALAGSLYFQIEHNEAAGVKTVGTEWERLIPVEGTVITRDTDHGAANDYTVYFYPIAGSGPRYIRLDQEMFPNWSPTDLLESCPQVNR